MIDHAATPPAVFRPSPVAILLILLLSGGWSSFAGESKPVAELDEKFDSELSKEWTWGLGTWTVKNGVLRGYESGPRRHGPVKMRRFAMRDGTIQCEFRLLGKAKFAGIILNGSRERGHIAHLIVGRDQIRLLAHPKKDEVVELMKEPHMLAIGEWHRVKLEFRSGFVTATLDGRTFSATHACLAEAKVTFGLGGDSGGPEGEIAGALEFRNLQASADTR